MMMPSLLVGDFILVNKYAYGVRLPVLGTKVLEVGDPQRGDVIVFIYPEDESKDYIKRVIGLPDERRLGADESATGDARYYRAVVADHVAAPGVPDVGRIGAVDRGFDQLFSIGAEHQIVFDIRILSKTRQGEILIQPPVFFGVGAFRFPSVFLPA